MGAFNAVPYPTVKLIWRSCSLNILRRMLNEFPSRGSTTAKATLNQKYHLWKSTPILSIWDDDDDFDYDEWLYLFPCEEFKDLLGEYRFQLISTYCMHCVRVTPSDDDAVYDLSHLGCWFFFCLSLVVAFRMRVYAIWMSTNQRRI